MKDPIYGFHRWIDAGRPDCSLIVVSPTDRPILAVRIAWRQWRLTYDYDVIGDLITGPQHTYLFMTNSDGTVTSKTTTDHDTIYSDMVNYY